MTPFLASCLEHINVIIRLNCFSGLLLLITVKQKTNDYFYGDLKEIRQATRPTRRVLVQ